MSEVRSRFGAPARGPGSGCPEHAPLPGPTRLEDHRPAAERRVGADRADPSTEATRADADRGPLTIHLPSPLYPFRRGDLAAFEHDGFRLTHVYGRITEAQRRACVTLWLGAGVLPSARVAWQRSAQVCYLLTDARGGTLVGVNTLYPAPFPVLDNRQPGPGGGDWLWNRMFIHPHYRRTRLMIVATTATLCWLALAGGPNAPSSGRGDLGPVRGVVNANENTKLHRPGMRRLFERIGYRYAGSAAGREIWYVDLDDIRFVDGPAA